MQTDWSTIIRQLPIWVVYRWHFIETNAVYIGLTSCYERRIYQEYRYRKASLVKDYLDATGCTFTVSRLHSRLTGKEASALERAEITQHNQNGYTVLNKNNGGALGRYSGMTEDRIANIIDQCQSYKEFRTKYPREYSSLQYHGWTHLLLRLQDYSPTHHRTNRYIQSLSDQQLYEIAFSCRTKSEFKTRHASDYKEAIRRGLYRKIESNVAHWKQSNHKSTDELREIADDDIRAKASLCSSKRNFKSRYYSEYNEAVRRNMIDDLFKPRANPSQLTDDELISTAKQSGSVSKCRKKRPSVYNEIVRRGIIGRLAEEVPPLRVNIDHTYTHDELCEIAKTCKSRTEFKTNHRVAYEQAYRDGIYQDIIKLIPKQTGRCRKIVGE